MNKEIGVDISRVRPLTIREKTTATTGKSGRSIVLDVKFENGEDFNIKIAGKSISYFMKPDLSIFSSKVSDMVFGLMRTESGPELAIRLKEAAEAAPDIETWIENINSGYRHSNAPTQSGPKR